MSNLSSCQFTVTTKFGVFDSNKTGLASVQSEKKISSCSHTVQAYTVPRVKSALTLQQLWINMLGWQGNFCEGKMEIKTHKSSLTGTELQMFSCYAPLHSSLPWAENILNCSKATSHMTAHVPSLCCQMEPARTSYFVVLSLGKKICYWEVISLRYSK